MIIIKIISILLIIIGIIVLVISPFQKGTTDGDYLGYESEDDK